MNAKSALLKYIIGIAVIASGFCAYHVYKSNHLTKVDTSIVLQKIKEIDKLYTGVYIIPALDSKYGFLKRDLPGHWCDEIAKKFGINCGKETEKVVKGYCKKRYEVSVGYDNISELLGNKEVIDNACHGRTDELPDPQILAVNCCNTEAHGDYSGNDICYSWDIDENTRKSVLQGQMETDKILEKVNKRGRESLKTLATIFCE